jgi:hypothetical protein
VGLLDEMLLDMELLEEERGAVWLELGLRCEIQITIAAPSTISRIGLTGLLFVFGGPGFIMDNDDRSVCGGNISYRRKSSSTFHEFFYNRSARLN